MVKKTYSTWTQAPDIDLAANTCSYPIGCYQYHCHLSYQIAPLSNPHEPYNDLGLQDTKALSPNFIPRQNQVVHLHTTRVFGFSQGKQVRNSSQTSRGFERTCGMRNRFQVEQINVRYLLHTQLLQPPQHVDKERHTMVSMSTAGMGSTQRDGATKSFLPFILVKVIAVYNLRQENPMLVLLNCDPSSDAIQWYHQQSTKTNKHRLLAGTCCV